MVNSLNCKKDYTQSELAAMYKYQQSEEGKIAMESRKAFLKEMKDMLWLSVPLQEVGVITNLQTGKKQYFIKKG